jgi:hypothetical protein
MLAADGGTEDAVSGGLIVQYAIGNFQFAIRTTLLCFPRAYESILFRNHCYLVTLRLNFLCL